MDEIDEILFQYYQWSQSYSVERGYKGYDLACRDFRSSRQWMDYDDLDSSVEHTLREATGKAVEPLVMALDRRYRVAINNAMRNFQLGLHVWDEDGYTEAKALLRGKLVAKGLIQKRGVAA